MAYCRCNPGLGLQDLFKYLYQSCLGCEHFVADEAKALAHIYEELPEAGADDLPEVEWLEGDFCRFHLKGLKDGATPEILCRLFLRSAQKQPEGAARLTLALEEVLALAREGRLPFSREEAQGAVARWKSAGLPPLHHSEEFRKQHHPAYRVIRKEFLKELFYSENELRHEGIKIVPDDE